jgi:taurine dioxygenase
VAEKTRSTLKITKIKPQIGAEVTGIDLSKPVDAETRAQLNQAILDNVCLVFRDQNLTPQQFLDAMSLFGEPMDQDSPQFAVPGVPKLRVISNRNRDSEGKLIRVGVRWHTDHTNKELPPKYTCLYPVELPSTGGGTSVANMRAGYESLPADLKKQVDAMKTVNVRLGSGVKDKYNTESIHAQQALRPAPVIQPLIRTNAENGTKAIYCHPNKTENIVGMDPVASQEFLDKLIETAVKPEFVYSHAYRKGDILMWDNRSSLHKANYGYNPADPKEHRMVYRALIQDVRPK